MIKAVLLISSFLSLIAPSEPSFEVLVTAEQNNEIVDQNGSFLVLKKVGQLALKYQNASWEILFPENEAMKMINRGNQMMIIYQVDGYLMALVVDNNGNLIFSNRIVPNRLGAVWDVVITDEIFICGCIENYEDVAFKEAKTTRSLNKRDAIIMAFNNNLVMTHWKIFGGRENESFTSMAVSDQKIYLVGKKDPYSGGDFGNGGLLKNNNFICSLDYHFNLGDYFVFDNNNSLIDVDFIKESVFVWTNTALYKFDDHLTIIKKRLFESTIFFGIISAFHTFLGFGIENIAIVNLLDLNKLADIYCEEINEDTQYQQLDSVIKIINGYETAYLDVFDFRSFRFPPVHYDNLPAEGPIKSIFGEVTIKDKTSLPLFNPLVFGTYTWNINLQTSFGLEYVINRQTLVQKEVNVSENNIYPLGYHLHFTGNALLNGQAIVNNYALNESGIYQLTLIGANNEQYSLSFAVAREQIPFEELPERNWHFETRRSGIVQIDLSLQGDWSNLEGVIINGEAFDDFLFDQVNQRLLVRFKAPDEMGIYHYFIDSIIYRQDNDRLSYPIKYMFTVNVLGFEPEIVIEEINDFEYLIKVNDDDACARSISVHAVSNLDDYVINLPLSDSNIVFPNLNKKQNYELTYFLNYDIGNHQIASIELLSAKMSGKNASDFGEITILEKTNQLKKLTLSFLESKDSITEIIANNHFVYQKPVNNIFSVVLVGGLCFSVSYFLMWGFKKIRHKTRRRYF
ncbi:MAG TPA: hypothetical protein PLR16_02360 [Bacilli bacterium]|nr:MAG: hypothetical protein BWY97_00656 [Tenericutes bacterium ADurb.BinA124]HNZ50584.1 hypothetical protein [Bacilli bacterium]HPX84111.1 hypothetical protein [Bacilli bacterium]